MPGLPPGLALFDFDGTITSRDTLFDFILFACGSRRFCIGFAFLMPILISFKLGFIKNSTAKERVLSYFFSGWDIVRFSEIANRYSSERIPQIIRPEARKALEWHKSQNHRIVVVTASMVHYLDGWCRQEAFDLIGTEMEIHECRLTGQFKTKNCNGAEKARLVREKYPIDQYVRIWAYGDSDADRELLALATDQYFCWKKIK